MSVEEKKSVQSKLMPTMSKEYFLAEDGTKLMLCSYAVNERSPLQSQFPPFLTCDFFVWSIRYGRSKNGHLWRGCTDEESRKYSDMLGRWKDKHLGVFDDTSVRYCVVQRPITKVRDEDRAPIVLDTNTRMRPFTNLLGTCGTCAKDVFKPDYLFLCGKIPECERCFRSSHASKVESTQPNKG